ncbi:MAG: aspartyl protease family protein [Chitinophagales bacterium]|nr:aspartyl protease family protein [Chitinophagales bacterium]
MFNNILIVDVRVNKTKTLKFIFDSGCKSTIIIHPKWLDSFDIPYKQKVFFSGLGFKDSIETMKVDDGTLELGQLKGEHIPIFILSKDSLNLDHYLGTDVDGIFGAEIFEKYYVRVNYKTKLIELYNQRPDKKLKNSYQKMAVQMRKSKGYLSCMILNNKNELFMSELLLDTGSNIPVIIKNKEPADLHLDKYINAEIGEGLSGALYSKVSRIKRIFIDTLKLDSVIVAFNETPITFKDLDENTLDGNIGNDILNRLDMYFAYPENAIYFKPTQRIKEPFDFNISNIILLENKSKNNGFIIKSIAGDSPPLLAGLLKGDEIIKIDRYKCSDINIEDALLLLNKRIGKKITIQYQRNNVISKVTYKLVSII